MSNDGAAPALPSDVLYIGLLSFDAQGQRAEVAWPQYERQPCTFKLVDPGTSINSHIVQFPPCDSAALIVTGIAIWNAGGQEPLDIELVAHKLLRPGDVMVFMPGEISFPIFQ